MVNLMKNDKEACLLCRKIWDPVEGGSKKDL